jgi:nucleoside-diphosphate-sugar epimerase
MATLPKGSLVLVTGASGWIASHVVDQALQAGYNVRGCVRAPERGQWLVDYVSEKYGPKRIELAIVPDMAVEGAFVEAVKGVDAFIHVASDLSFSADAHKVVEGTHKAVRCVIAAIAAEPKMKHFIYTSSASAVGFPQVNVPHFVAQDSWNVHSYNVAMDDSVTAENDPMKAAHVYAGSKYIAEKEALSFGREQDRIVVNSVVPNMNWGPLLEPKTQPADKLSSGALIPGLYEKGLEGLSWFKDVPPRKSCQPVTVLC